MTQQRKTRVLVTGATGFLGGNIINGWQSPHRLHRRLPRSFQTPHAVCRRSTRG